MVLTATELLWRHIIRQLQSTESHLYHPVILDFLSVL